MNFKIYNLISGSTCWGTTFMYFFVYRIKIDTQIDNWIPHRLASSNILSKTETSLSIKFHMSIRDWSTTYLWFLWKRQSYLSPHISQIWILSTEIINYLYTLFFIPSEPPVTLTQTLFGEEENKNGSNNVQCCRLS